MLLIQRERVGKTGARSAEIRLLIIEPSASPLGGLFLCVLAVSTFGPADPSGNFLLLSLLSFLIVTSSSHREILFVCTQEPLRARQSFLRTLRHISCRRPLALSTSLPIDLASVLQSLSHRFDYSLPFFTNTTQPFLRNPASDPLHFLAKSSTLVFLPHLVVVCLGAEVTIPLALHAHRRI